MKKWMKIALGCLLFVAVLSFAIFYCDTHPLPGSTAEPPQIGVRYEDELCPVRAGGFYWTTRYLFGSSSAIADAALPWEALHLTEFKLDPSKDRQEAILCFEKAPGNVQVYCMDSSVRNPLKEEPCEVIPSDCEKPYSACYRVTLSEEDCYYRISASWKDGNASYYFCMVK